MRVSSSDLAGLKLWLHEIVLVLVPAEIVLGQRAASIPDG